DAGFFNTGCMDCKTHMEIFTEIRSGSVESRISLFKHPVGKPGGTGNHDRTARVRRNCNPPDNRITVEGDKGTRRVRDLLPELKVVDVLLCSVPVVFSHQ